MKTIFLLAAIYGTLVGGSVKHAPANVKFGGAWRGTSTLAEPQANSLGYLMVVDERPVCPSNCYAVAKGWTEGGDPKRIRRVYEILPLPPPTARRLYKYDISVAAMELGEITNLVACISADAGTKWMWDAAEIIVEDDPFFVAATNEIITAGVASEAKVKAIIERAWELGNAAEATK